MYDDYEEREYRPGLGGTFVLMAIITTALFWVPGFNGLIAGLVGGHRAGTVGRAFGLSVAASLATAGTYGFLFLFFRESLGYLTWGFPPAAYLGVTAGLMIVSATLAPLIERKPIPEGVVRTRRPLFRRRVATP